MRDIGIVSNVEREAADIIEAVLTLTRGQVPESFVRQYYSWPAVDDLREQGPERLAEIVLATHELSQRRIDGQSLVAMNRGSVDMVNDDMPFVVDSVMAELNRQGIRMLFTTHAVIRVHRDPDGNLVDGSAGHPGRPESFIHIEVDHPPDEVGLRRVLGQVRAAVEDWPRMRGEARRIAAELMVTPVGADPEEAGEARALLQWMDHGFFTFLGYRAYDQVIEAGTARLRPVPGTGLGLLRDESACSQSTTFAELPPEIRQNVGARLLNLTKSNGRSPVHRPAYMDYVGIQRIDGDGNLVGEWRFLGLYTTSAQNCDPRQAPVMRRKVARVLQRAGFPADGYQGKALIDIMYSYPRDELLQIDDDQLFQIATGILHLGERQRLRLFVRRDPFGRYVSCLVYLPRERFNPENQIRIQEILQSEFRGTGIDARVRLTESVLARLHVVVYTKPEDSPDVQLVAVEARLTEATRSWAQDLQRELADPTLFARYSQAFPAAYRADFAVAEAARDIAKLETLDPEVGLRMRLYRHEGPHEGEGAWRLKVYRSGDKISLSQFLPMLEHLGVRVVDERPYRAQTEGGPVWIYDLGLSCPSGELDHPDARQRFEDAFAQIWRGDLDDDGFNRLVLRAGLSAREVLVLRALSRYQRQVATAFSAGYLQAALVAHPEVARLLVQLFIARFDLDGDRSQEPVLHERLEAAVDAIPSLNEDRILRGLWGVGRAILRTNYFQRENGAFKPYVSFKFDPDQIPDLPLPRPKFEIWVYSRRMEGCHLRAGPVSRGGIRWSDRREDFRTEVLGLMKAQTVKNTVIVPVGAKGGFVVKQPPVGDHEALQREVITCYRTLIQGMLDLTDNLVGGSVVHPSEVVRYDDDDPYLVVAADKGTATFSDIANGLAQERGFWLDDAFASGGSAGYDHKRMGITSRGAWESIRRHFREMGVNVDTTPITVVGIGDMSGDVFGNGLLQTRHLKLVGAFNHRHIFLDPNPDPEVGYRERERLFNLPRSAWSDYDAGLISKGGGVFDRTAKSVPLSAEIRAVLGVDADELTPTDLIKAILRAPVDMLWNGGIGTYVKATVETHAEVGDKANDPLRVNGRDLRCKVVAEGGNLGLTQRGRVEYALAGGRLNTDAIDNSAGVDTSDHEVNIKILCNGAMAAGELTEAERNLLLPEMTKAIAAHVLRNNYEQTQTLSSMQALAIPMLDTHARLIRVWEKEGRINSVVEFLPDAAAMAARRAAGEGLSRPEMAVLLAYGKIALYSEILASDLPNDPHLDVQLETYFPRPLVERFPERVRRHRLRREIIATTLCNSILNRSDPTLMLRLGDETGASCAEIVAAHRAGWEAFGLESIWTEVAALDNVVPASIQTQMLAEVSRLGERSARWLLTALPRPIDIGKTVSRFRAEVERVTIEIPRLLSSSDRRDLEKEASRLTRAGVPIDLAARAAALGPSYSALDMVLVAQDSEHDVLEVAAVYLELGSRLHLHWLRDRILDLPRDERWSSLARAALRDDLYGLQTGLTGKVLRYDGGRALDPDQRIEAWSQKAGRTLMRCRQVMEDIRLSGTFDLATLSVALRELRSVVNTP